MTVQSLQLGAVSVPVKRALRSEFLRHGGLVFVSGIVVNAFAYVFHLMALHRLSVSDYGVLSSLLAGLTIASVPATIVTMIVVRYASEFHAVGDKAKLCKLSLRLLRVTGIAAALIVVAALIGRSAIANYLHFTDQIAPVLASLVLALTLMIPAARGLLQAKQHFGAFAISTALEGTGRASLGLAGIYLGAGVRGALLGFAAGGALSLIYTWIAVRRDWVTPARRLLIDVRRLLHTVGGVATTTACLTTMGFVDLLLVKHYFSPHDAGIYGAVSLAGRALFFMVSFLPAVLLPKATAKQAAGGDPRPVLAAAFAATCIIAVGVLTAFAVVPVTWIAGNAYAAAGSYLVEYGIAIAFLSLTGLVTTYKIAIHRFDFLWPLISVTVLEIVAISLYHPSLRAVVGILLAGHAVAFASSLYRVARLSIPAADQAGAKNAC